MRTIYSRGLNKVFGSKYQKDYRIRRQIPEERGEDYNGRNVVCINNQDEHIGPYNKALKIKRL